MGRELCLGRSVRQWMKDCGWGRAGEPMAELCRGFGISRKTGYKIFDRYQECGIQGLTDRSRRPYGYANQLPFQVAIDSSIDHGTHSRFTLAGWPSIGA